MPKITFRKMHFFKRRSLILLIFSFLSSFSFAVEHIDPYLTAAISSEPSSIVGGCINAVTGDLVFASTDLIATGEELSTLDHIYTSRLRNSNFPGGLLLGEHLIITCFSNNVFIITEPSGIQLSYYMPSFHAIGEKERKEHLNIDKILQLDPESLKCLSNSSDFKISGRTNIRNNIVKYNQKQGTLVIHSPDGSRRHYSSNYITSLLADKKKKDKKAKFHNDFYKLVNELKIFPFKLDKYKLSNGNWIFYTYNDQDLPIEIKVTNPSTTKTYAKINTTINNNELTCTTGCNKTLKIHGNINIQWLNDQIVEWNKEKHRWKKDIIPRILGFTYGSKIPPEKPQESFNYLDHHGKVISDCILPDKRQLHIDYYTLGDHIVKNTPINIPNTQDSRFMRVKSISILGETDPLQKIYSFIYHPGILDQSNGSTEVYDSEGNKTIYKYSAQLRLDAIERYILENNEYKKINSEQFVWGKNTESTFLSCKTIYDSQKAISSKHFIYDGKGNLIKEISYGNLSGQCQMPLVIENGLPKINGIETFTIERSFSDDNRNLLIQQKDDNGLITTFSYQANTDKIASKLISYEHPSQIKQRIFYEYDHDNILIREIQDDGSSTDKNNLTNVTRRTIKVINPRQTEPYGLTDSIEERYLDIKTGEDTLIRKETYDYNINRRIQKKEIFGSDGEPSYSLSYEYDDKGNIKLENDPLGRKAKYEYDLNDNKKYEKDFSGKETFFEYDLCNRLIKKTIKDDSKSFVEEYEYDLKNNKLIEKDLYGNIKKYEYDAFNNLTKEIFPQVQDTFGDINTPIKSYKYDDLGRQIEKTDPLLNVTTTSFNALNKPIRIEYPDNTSEEYLYNLNGTLKEHINQERLITKYDYDYLQRVKIKQIYSPTGVLLREEIFEYSAFDLTSKKDLDGNITKYTYDGYGRKIKEEFFSKDQILFSIEEIFYDELGFIAKKIKGNDLVTIYTRDLLGRVLKKRKETANKKILFKIRYKYDVAGNKERITSYIAGKKSFENRKYDLFNRLIKTTDALENETTFEYNDFFQNDLDQKVKQIIHENALKQKTITTYDALDREKIIENKRSDDLTISFEEKFYDLNNNLTRQKSTIYNPDRSKRDVITYWHYDNMNRLDILKEAYNSKDEKTTLYSYTDIGKLKTTTKPDGVLLKNKYDPLGNKIRLHSSKRDIDYQFIYNNLNQLIKINDKINKKKTIRKYDVLGNLLEETLSNGLTLKSEYDLLSNRTKLIFPDNTSAQYIYDSLILKKIIRKDSSHNPLYEHTFLEYDLSGNLIKEELISNAGFIDYEIDLLEQITSVQTPYHTQKTTFDEIGRISKIEWQNFLDSTSEYKYDDLNQIKSETGKFSNNYEFDSHYNRLKKNKDIYQINDLNQVLTTNEKKFAYDKNGNPIIKKTKYGEMKYVYDSLDRLIKIKKPKSCILEFTYDPLNRRTSKKTFKYSCINGYSEDDFRYFLYDDQSEIGSFDENFIQKELRILSNNETAEIGSAISFEIDQNLFTPIYDISGNVISLIDNDSLKEHYRYSAFGEKKIYSSSGSEKKHSQINNPWQFSSKRIDEETNLTYFGRRYYDPKLGRWLTPDPKGFIDGLNLYAFVSNDPLTTLDLYGLYANPFMFPPASQRGNDFAAAMFHRTADFGADSLRMLSHVGFGISTPFLYSYHAITQKGSLGNDFQRHLQNSNMIKKDVRTFMQKVMPANQNSRAYQTSSMITTGALDGIALGSATAAGYQFINKAASFTNNALTAMKNISLKPTNVSTAEMFPTNRVYSGLDVEKIIKNIKINSLMKDKFNVQSLKEFKQLVNNLSKPGSKLSQNDLNKLRTLTNKFGGKIRVDLEGIKGSGVSPHVHVENLGNKIKSRHIWLKGDVQ